MMATFVKKVVVVAVVGAALSVPTLRTDLSGRVLVAVLGKEKGVEWMSPLSLALEKRECVAEERKTQRSVGLLVGSALGLSHNWPWASVVFVLAAGALVSKNKSSRRPRIDPGSSKSCESWVRGPEGLILYEKSGVRVTETPALDEIGGSWRCLRTANGGVVQSAVRVVDGHIHAGALAGYTRALAAAAIAACGAIPDGDTTRRRVPSSSFGSSSSSSSEDDETSSSFEESTKVLKLGLGGGSVSHFLCAHLRARVVAVELSSAVVEAARATVSPVSNGYVDVVVADAVTYVRDCESSFDVVVVDVFDEESCLPPALATTRFAEDLVSLVAKNRGGLALNLVSETALGDKDVASVCADAAVAVVTAFEKRGGDAFLTRDKNTQNAVLWCLFFDEAAADNKQKTRWALDRALRRAEATGIQFDVSSELANTVHVDASSVRDRLLYCEL